MAMNRGAIPERLFNEFGKNLKHIVAEGKNTLEETVQVAEIIQDFMQRENVKTDDVLAKELQAIENADFERKTAIGEENILELPTEAQTTVQENETFTKREQPEKETIKEPTKVKEKKTVSNSLRDKAKQVREQGVNKAFNLPEAKLPDGTQQAGFGGKGLNEAIAKSLEIVADGIDAGKEILDAAKEGFENIKAYYKDNAKSFDEKILRDKFIDNIAESKEQAEILKKGFEKKVTVIEPDTAAKNAEVKELDKLANNVPDSGKVAEYMSKDTIEKYTDETPTNNQQRGVQELEIALEHGEKIIEKAKEIYGTDYVEKTLDYIENSTASVSNKALMYVSLENALGREKLLNPEKSADIAKKQALVYAKSQAFARESSLALNYQKLRKIAQVGYDISKVTDSFFSAEERMARNDLSKAIEANANEINKEAALAESGSLTIEENTSNPKIDNATKEKNANVIKRILK